MSLTTVEIPIDFPPENQDCDACAARLREELSSHRGITAVEPWGSAGVRVTYDPELCSLTCMEEAAGTIGATVLRRFRHSIVAVDGMDCYDCAQTISRAVERLDGVSYATVNFPAGRMRVEFEESHAPPVMERVRDRVESLGYKVNLEPRAPEPAEKEEGSTFFSRHRERLPTATASLLLLAALVASWFGADPWVANSLYAASIVVGGASIARSGMAALIATRRPDINFLMTVAVIGAAGIGAWLEGALVVVLFSIGETLERMAMDRARSSLSKLIQLAPETARVVRQGREIEVPVRDVAVGEEVVIRPGERVSVDGRVVRGGSSVDEAAITGESIPVEKEAGSEVFSGTFNGEGQLFVEVSRSPGDTTLARIGRAIEEAQLQRSPAERWVDRFARVYTPIVIGVALVTSLVPPMIGLGPFTEWFYRGLAFLILACPCALVISTPVAVVSALARASAAGVLVKGGAHLEAAASVSVIALDKTGTLTQGKPRVQSVVSFDGRSDDEVISMVAALESASEHPLARAIVDEAARRGLTYEPVDEFEAVRGFGVRGLVAGRRLAAGSPRLFADHPGSAATEDVVRQLEEKGQTLILLADTTNVLGILGLADVVRVETAAALAHLRSIGIRKIVLLTGDRSAPARAIATDLGITDVRSELLPVDKVAEVTRLGEREGAVAMVGDGVNDAPALACSSLGIAMGSAGSPIAIETADVALMGDDLGKVAGLIGLSRWARSVVRQNIIFSLLVKAVAAVLALTGALTLWMAVLADVGATLLVVANGLRLLGAKPFGPTRTKPLLARSRRTGPA